MLHLKLSASDSLALNTREASSSLMVRILTSGYHDIWLNESGCRI